MNRGDVYETRLEPTEGSEQAGTRPAVVVSRDSLNQVLNIVIIVPLSSLRPGRAIRPNQALVAAPEGGLTSDSVALCEQVRAVSKSRLLRQRGSVSAETMALIERGLAVALAMS